MFTGQLLRLRHYNSAGTLIAEFDSTQLGYSGRSMSISGLAMDTDNNHLWAIRAHQITAGRYAGSYIEFDVSNAAAPTTRQQGPLIVASDSLRSTGGCDYDECNDRLLLAEFIPSPVSRGEVECWVDNNPAGIAAPSFLQACVVEPPIPQNWGIALNADLNLVSMPNLDVVANANHTIYTADRPCDPVPPATPTAVTSLRSGNDVIVRWNAPVAGRYIIYKTTVRNNDGNPDGGSDADFSVEATVTVPAGAASYTDVGSFDTDVYLNYVVVAICP